VTGAPIVLAVAAAAFAACSFRLDGLAATVVAGWLALVAQVGAVTWALSPFHAVTLPWLTGVEAALAVVAGLAWMRRGRPLPALATAHADLRSVAGDPLTLAFLVLLLAGLAYELVLALTVPPNNWDSLTYHLARVAAWHQAHGVHWIANAPTGRMNEFQPLAEQLVLFLVTAGSTALFALPQYAAELAILVAVYGAARRLGYSARAAARGTALVAMLSLVALESTTAQNDLVAASLTVAAAFLLLGVGRLEPVLAGAAVALGLGVKLTTALALPVLAVLAVRRGQRTLAPAAAGVVAGLVAAGGWGYVLNLIHTGQLLGHGQGRVENSAATTAGGTGGRFLHLVYRLFDLSVMPNWLVALLAAGGVLAALQLVSRAHARASAAGALLLLAPLLALGVIEAFALDASYVPRAASEDVSSFGPVGTALLLAAPAAALAPRERRRDHRLLALALTLPTYMVLLAAVAKYNVWICRFLLVPVILAAPLFAALCRGRVAAAALLLLGGLTLVFALTDDASKKLRGPAGAPWTLSQLGALRAFAAQPTGTVVAGALAAYDRAVPAHACVGAVLDADEPSYLLWGPGLHRRVDFLPSLDALGSARRDRLRYVVVSTGGNAPVARTFSGAGWRVRPLGSYWQLAVAPPLPGSAVCRAG
jgi:glycosyl transferase family 87